MRLRWTAPAAQDLYNIVSAFSGTILPLPTRWHKLSTMVAASWETFLVEDAKGKMEGTQELVFAGLPYIVVYRIQDLEILRIHHGAQDWP
jgi:plasmid stabilization system protein ParE